MWRDRIFWACMGAGVLFWALLHAWTRPGWDPEWPLNEPLVFLRVALAYPVLEEIVFRGALQPYLARHLPPWPGPVGPANVAASALFTALHFYTHPALWAAAVFISSLVFGFFRDRHNSLQTPIALHAFYNTGYYWIFSGR